MFLCLLRRRIGVVEPCNTITACSFLIGMKARQGIPERPSSGTADTLLLAEIKEVCGTGDEAAGLYERDARKGFPDDMLQVKNNALFYVHGRGSVRSGVEQLLCLTTRADGLSASGNVNAPTCLSIRSPAVTAKTPPSHNVLGLNTSFSSWFNRESLFESLILHLFTYAVL